MVSETYERVLAALAALRGRYGSCPVRQTTIPVPSDAYERLRALSERSVVDAGVRVRNERGEVLSVRKGSGWSDPYRHVSSTEPIEAGACRALREAADVGCSIDGLLGVTILGITDAEDASRAPVYRLGALFDGGSAIGAGDERSEDCRWRSATSGPFVDAY